MDPVSGRRISGAPRVETAASRSIHVVVSGTWTARRSAESVGVKRRSRTGASDLCGAMLHNG